MPDPEEEFPVAFIEWYSKWAGVAPVIDDDDAENAYAAWYAGHEAGIEYERDWHECPTCEHYD